MKKIAMIVTALTVALSLCACGGSGNNNTVSTTNAATTQPSAMPTLPSSEPTVATNIPDPSIDTGMPDTTDNFSTGSTGETNSQQDMNRKGGIMG